MENAAPMLVSCIAVPLGLLGKRKSALSSYKISTSGDWIFQKRAGNYNMQGHFGNLDFCPAWLYADLDFRSLPEIS